MSDLWATIAAERGAFRRPRRPDAGAVGHAVAVAGLALCATDHDWRHRQGEAVEGPLLSLLLAMTGRAPACDDLIGPGVPTLRSRCAAKP